MTTRQTIAAIATIWLTGTAISLYGVAISHPRAAPPGLPRRCCGRCSRSRPTR